MEELSPIPPTPNVSDFAVLRGRLQPSPRVVMNGQVMTIETGSQTFIGTTEGIASIGKKLAAVMKGAQRVPKNGFNKHFNYSYATESDVSDVIRELLAEQKLGLLPGVVDYEVIPKPTSKAGDILRLDCQFTFVCGDTGALAVVNWCADGQDSADKGFYKAYTGAKKYLLLVAFLISTGDDPEAVQQHQQPEQRGPQAKVPQNPEYKPAEGEPDSEGYKPSALKFHLGSGKWFFAFGEVADQHQADVVAGKPIFVKGEDNGKYVEVTELVIAE